MQDARCVSAWGRGTVAMLVNAGNHLGFMGQRPVLATDIEIKMCHQHRHTQLEVSVDISGELCSRG